jgi:phosphohistidine phosphatase SixA
MIISLMRHADAVSVADAGGLDVARTLSDLGKKRLRGAVPLIAKAKLPVQQILTSPYPRALETAELVGEAFPGIEIKKVVQLQAGARVPTLKEILKKEIRDVPSLVVGHMPDLAVFASLLSGLPSFLEEGMTPGEIVAIEDGKFLWRKKLEDWRV